MIPARTVLRSTRAVRVNAPALRRNARFATDSAATSTSSGVNPALIGGLAGGAFAFLAGYGFYYMSGAKTAMDTVHSTKQYYDSLGSGIKAKFNEKTPEPSQMLEALKHTATSYAGFVPGGKHYVDKVFKDLESVHEKHGSEVDEIVRDAYAELQEASKKGLTMSTATEVYEIGSKYVQKLTSLAGDAAQDIIGNHPELKEKLGGSFEQLQQLGDRLGPEAKKQVDQTWKQVQDITKSGLQWDTADKIRKLVQEKMQEVQKLGDEAWKSGMEQMKPLLEKKPELKKLVEDNVDSLKQGNAMEVVNKVRDAVSSGSTSDLEKYIQQAKDKGQQLTSGNSDSSGGMSSWLSMLPSGGAIMPQLQKLKEVAEKKGPEAEKLAKETMDEIKSVLDKKSKQIEDLLK